MRPNVFQLVEHVFAGVVDVNFHVRSLQVGHGELPGKRADKEGSYRVDGCDLVRQERPFGLGAILQEYQTWNQSFSFS